MKDGYSLHQFLAETNATVDVIDYIIQTKYSYLLLINHERNAYVVISTDNYKSMELKEKERKIEEKRERRIKRSHCF